MDDMIVIIPDYDRGDVYWSYDLRDYMHCGCDECSWKIAQAEADLIHNGG